MNSKDRQIADYWAQLQAERAKVARLREALAPFALAAEHIRPDPAFSGWSFSSDAGTSVVTPGDYAQARAALRETGGTDAP